MATTVTTTEDDQVTDTAVVDTVEDTMADQLMEATVEAMEVDTAVRDTAAMGEVTDADEAVALVAFSDSHRCSTVVYILCLIKL